MKKPQILSPAKTAGRKRPAHLYSKANPSPHAFKPGQSGNLGGRGGTKDPYKLVSRAMRNRLNTPAPHDVARAAGLPPGASWAQVLGNTLVDMAVFHKDLAAARLVLEYCDAPLPRTARLELSDANGEPLQPPALNIVLVSTGAPQHGPQPVARKLPGKPHSLPMLDSDAAEHTANGIVAAIAKGAPRSIETVNKHLPPGWVLAADIEAAELAQATSAAHWQQVARSHAVPR